MARVLEEWEGRIGALEVVPGRGGIFDVHVDGDLVFTKEMLGSYPNPEDVLPHIAARLG